MTTLKTQSGITVKKDNDFHYFFKNGVKVSQCSNIVVKNNFALVESIIYHLCKH